MVHLNTGGGTEPAVGAQAPPVQQLQFFILCLTPDRPPMHRRLHPRLRLHCPALPRRAHATIKV